LVETGSGRQIDQPRPGVFHPERFDVFAESQQDDAADGQKIACGLCEYNRDPLQVRDVGMGTKSMQGQTAVPFELPDHRGRLHRYEDYAGHWLLLVFHRHLA
jgi:hypothetical protein